MKEEDQGIKMSNLCTFYRLLSFTKKGSEYVPMGEYKSDKLSIGGSDSCQVSCYLKKIFINYLYSMQLQYSVHDLNDLRVTAVGPL